MFELIRANKKKSVILFAVMGAVLILLGYLIGAAFDPREGGWFGLAIALAVWAVLSFISYTAGDSIILRMSGAKEVTHDVHPQLFNVVEEMKIASGLPSMPRVYIIPDESPNAFATGRNPANSAIAVTAGLLSRLNRDELQGVIAHEMSHVLNRDVLFMTFAGVMLGTIVIISEVFFRGMFLSSRHSRYRRSSSSKGGGQAQIVIMIAAILFAILAPIFARLLYFAISRKREYLADASAARLTRYPEGLASALEKISDNPGKLEKANRVTAPMYIISPLYGDMKKLSALSSTHPPIQERIGILRAMGQGAGYQDYQKAYAGLHKGGLIPASGLQEAREVPVRAASVSREDSKSQKKSMRELGDLIRAVDRYAFLACACGMKIKIPPEFKKEKLNCPRCNREHAVPLAELAAVAAVVPGITGGRKEAGSDAGALKPHEYKRRTQGWETFMCGSCGRPIQLSPSFDAPRIDCKGCGTTTQIM